MTDTAPDAERRRLREADASGAPWRRWGPYLSDRQWGTVREDYSAGGDAWGYVTHDQARSRAYRWGEDGIAGISDDEQLLCLAVAMWNGRDPIIKERFFGVTNAEGNHGEDVKEYYFYLDNTPTHSYMRMLYKYPQRRFPYDDLVATNRSREPPGVRVRAARHGCLRRQPLLRRGGRVRQGGARGRAAADHRAQPGAGGGGAAPAADPVVPQHLVGTGRPGHCCARCRACPARPSSPRRTSGSVTGGCCAWAPHGCCSPTTTPTPSGSSAHRTRRRTSRTASTAYVVRARTGGGEPARGPARRSPSTSR